MITANKFLIYFSRILFNLPKTQYFFNQSHTRPLNTQKNASSQYQKSFLPISNSDYIQSVLDLEEKT